MSVLFTLADQIWITDDVKFAVMPGLLKYIRVLELFVPPLRLAGRQTREIITKAEVSVQSRFDCPSSREDILSSLVSLHKTQPKRFNKGEIVTEAFSAMSVMQCNLACLKLLLTPWQLCWQ